MRSPRGFGAALNELASSWYDARRDGAPLSKNSRW